MPEKNNLNATKTESADEIDLSRVIGEIIDKRWLVTSVTTVFVVLGLLYCLFSTPIYRADAMVQVEQNVGNTLLNNLNQLLPNSQPESAPEVELLKSRMILGKTVEDLGLGTVVEQKYFPIFGKGFARLIKSKPGQIVVSKFEIPESWEEDPSIKLEIRDSNNFIIKRDGDVILTGLKGKYYEKDGFSILVSDIDAKSGTIFKITHVTELAAINNLLDNLDVADKGKDTGVLGLILKGEDPILIQNTLDSITKNYLEQNVERKSEEDAKSLEFLREQLPKVRSALDTAEDKLNKYRQQKDSVDLSLEAKSVLDSIVAVDTELDNLTFKEAEISKLFTKDHPTYRALLEKRKTLEDERDELNKRVNAMPKTQQGILRLSRDVESGQEVYMQLLNKEQELSISKASTIGNVRIIDYAITQSKPVAPQKLIIILISLVFGLFISIGYIFIKAFLHQGIESPEQLEELGLSVYASIPLSEWQRKKDSEYLLNTKHRKLNVNKDLLLAFGNPADIAIEAIRSLRTSLHFAMMEAKNNIIMISGASPGIGKTFVSANLAAVITQAGLRVLFIDSDMRNGYAHELLGVDGKNGLSSVLAGTMSVKNVVVKAINNNDGFDFIPRGQIPPNPSELLMHKRLAEVIKWSSENYDLVIIDTPPILAVTDAAIIGKQAGTSLMVARFELNTPKEVEVSAKRFAQNGVEIKGIILNATIKKASNYYNYGYDYYAYSYNSDEKNNNK